MKINLYFAVFESVPKAKSPKTYVFCWYELSVSSVAEHARQRLKNSVKNYFESLSSTKTLVSSPSKSALSNSTVGESA